MMDDFTWTKAAFYRYQVGDRVALNETPWVNEASAGKVIEIAEHAKPKRTVYRVRLDDGSEVNAEEHHMRPEYGKVSSTYDDFLYQIRDEVATPLGPGAVKDRADTPLGRLYRVTMTYDGSTRDFLEHEVHLGRIPTIASPQGES